MLQIKIRAYPEMSILALDDNFSLNLCGMPTTCCVVIILGVKVCIIRQKCGQTLAGLGLGQKQDSSIIISLQ